MKQKNSVQKAARSFLGFEIKRLIGKSIASFIRLKDIGQELMT